MTDWRFDKGWTDTEIRDELRALTDRPRNFDDTLKLCPEYGWNHVWSRAIIGREPPGDPLAGGPFERARGMVERFDFSDPRIVVGHFDRSAPLHGRRMLLELKSLGLHFLCPVVIAEVRPGGAEDAAFGFCFETLDGHIEAGREWFVVTKDIVTGDVRFRIEAFWKAAQFPTWWSSVGFQLLGRRYQRAWHRLAHVRMRRLIADGAKELPAGELVHEGPPIATAPVQFYARRAFGRTGIHVEQEGEETRRDRLLVAASWGALAGVRSLLPPALLSTILARRHAPAPDRLSRTLASPRIARLLRTLAAAELVADKARSMPDRIDPAPLVGRALTGAASAAALAAEAGRRRSGPALLGAAVAVGSTLASWKARAIASRYMPGPAAGLIEDFFALASGLALAARLPLRASPLRAT